MERRNGSDRRKGERIRALAGMELMLWIEAADGSWQKGKVRIDDYAENGIGIILGLQLKVGQRVMVEGAPPEVSEGDTGRLKGTVAWSRPVGKGLFNAGIDIDQKEKILPETNADVDYYEFLQIHPKADPETIHRVYRLMAQRYHPDNQETGDAEKFRLLMQAYQTLSNLERRAAYDLQMGSRHKNLLRLAKGDVGPEGMDTERLKRKGLLGLLYLQRLRDPAHPGLPVQDMEELLGVPREHLEFTLWYLKNHGYVNRSDNGRYAITVAGVDHAEETGATPSTLGMCLLSAATTDSGAGANGAASAQAVTTVSGRNEAGREDSGQKDSGQGGGTSNGNRNGVLVTPPPAQSPHIPGVKLNPTAADSSAGVSSAAVPSAIGLSGVGFSGAGTAAAPPMPGANPEAEQAAPSPQAALFWT